jgi:hypothetical protein
MAAPGVRWLESALELAGAAFIDENGGAPLGAAFASPIEIH